MNVMWIKSCTGTRVNLNHAEKIFVLKIPHEESECQVYAIGHPYNSQVLFKGTEVECENYLQHLDVYLGVACAEVIMNPRNRATPK